MSAESHNRIVPEILHKLVGESDGESDCMVALESVVLGVMKYYRPKPHEAAEFLDVLTTSVIEKLKP